MSFRNGCEAWVTSAASAARPRTINAMSVDVEDYFHVGAFERVIDPRDWDRMVCRVERNVERLLALFARHGASATFFTLGWVAERYPHLVTAIASQGHEIASHGYMHRRVGDQTQAGFHDDIIRAKDVLEHLTGLPVRGYRAPSFSVGVRTLWALDCIRDAGYAYSSSIYPLRHDHYGMPDAPRFAHYPRPDLLEIPITTVRAFGRNFPAGGGGFFRLLPYAVSRRALNRVNQTDGQPAIFYLHPWEIDAEQPRVVGAHWKARFRHYLNLDRMEARLVRLLSDFDWARVDHVFLACRDADQDRANAPRRSVQDGGFPMAA